jgi:hypothetical protein
LSITYIEVILDTAYFADPCCSVTSVTPTSLTGFTGVYSGMSQILSGGTNGHSLLTQLSVPILLTEVATDLGYYSVYLTGRYYKKKLLPTFYFRQQRVIHIRFTSLILRTRSSKSFCPSQRTLLIGVTGPQHKL